MMGRKHRVRTGFPEFRPLAALMLILTTVLGMATPAAAQGSVDVAIFTTENGQPAYDACYVLVGYSEVGCDDNGDGRVMFAEIPYGTYTVRQVADLGPGRYVDDFTIDVVGNRNSAGFESFSATIVSTGGASSSSSASGASDIAIVTTENGQPAYDACYVIVDHSQVGCDENGDGKITFEAIPLGAHTVRQVADLGPNRAVPDFTIQVTGAASADGWERFNATITRTGGAVAGTQDISLITRDPDTGVVLAGTCYILLDYSNEGCDDNGDGQVTFDDMPPGTWTVRQTQAPAGYPAINDFPLTIDGTFPNVAVGYLVKQAPQQSLPGTRNVSVVFIDSQTRTKIDPSPICLQFHNVSQVGCDDDLPDGQVDFLDLAIGTHEVTYSNLPSGWQLQARVSIPSLTIETGQGPQIIYIGIDTAGSGAATGDAGIERSGSSEVVGEDGFALAIDGVSVSGASGVAPVGTTVQMRLTEQELPEVVGGFAASAGTGVDLTLGDGLQPASPVSITFAPDVVASWGAAGATDDLVPVVFASKADGSGVELADAQLLPDGSVVVTADHLSWYQPALASISGFADWLGEQIDIGLQMQSDEPDCVDETADDEGWAFSAIPNQVIWPCVTVAGEDLEVTLQNNSSQVWIVGSTSATASSPVASSVVGNAFVEVVDLAVGDIELAALVPPDGQVGFGVADAPEEIVFNAYLHEPMSVANSVVTVVSIILPNKKVQAVAKAVGTADCGLDFIVTGPPAETRLREGQIGSLVGSTTRCIGTVTEGLAGALISGVASFPGAVRSIGETAQAHVEGYEELSFTLSRFEDPADETEGSASSSSAWPSDRNDGPPALRVWLGANMYGFPDWIACDDARTYCLVGFPGEEHLLVQMSGLVPVATVDDAAPDPRQALLALGLSDEIVTQILGQ